MHSWLKQLGIESVNSGVFFGEWRGSGPVTEQRSPIDGQVIGSVRSASPEDVEEAITVAQEAFHRWRSVPGPVRGETIRRFGNALRQAKGDLARLVTLETGKIIVESEGEVQE